MSNRYRFHRDVSPFMQTQREANGYTTSYAQLRIHHRTHVDFPAHVGLEGTIEWDLSGAAVIRTPAEVIDSVNDGESLRNAIVSAGTDNGRPMADEDLPPVVLFQTGGEDLPDMLVNALADSEEVEVVGSDAARVGDLEAHRALLKSGTVLVENLVNLGEPSEREGYASIFPLLIEGCDDGAPAVVVFEPGVNG